MATASHPERPVSPSASFSDVALAVSVFAVSVVLLAAGDGGLDALGVVLTALATLPLATRRASPVGVFVATGVFSVLLRALAEPAGPPLGPTVALYFLAAGGDGSRAQTQRTLALAVAFLVVHVGAAGLREGTFPLTPIAFGVLVVGGAWLAGDRARLRHERMTELEQRALRAEREAEGERRLAAAEERTRIARDLHDSAGHAINVILVHAGLGRLRADDTGARDTFATIEDVARQTVADIDDLVGALREEEAVGRDVEPPAGLAALDTLAQRHRAAGLAVATGVHGDRRPLPPNVDRSAYRIVQEALTNAARHGGGSAEVDIAFGPTVLEISVANPVDGGRDARDSRRGHGLVGMRERAALLGGTLDATACGGQFRVHARLPLTPGGT